MRRTLRAILIGSIWCGQLSACASANSAAAPDPGLARAIPAGRARCPTDFSPITPFPTPEPVIAKKKRQWEQSLGGAEAAKPRIRARLVGWPEQLLADRATWPASDREFLSRVARDTWRGLDALTDRENGLPINNVRFASGSIAIADAGIGDYASGTDVGLHLIAIVAARELDLIDSTQAIEKIRRVLDTLERLETYHGFFFNYYDTTSLERTSNFVSFVDSSWLTAGLIVVRATFAELHARCSTLIARADYGLFFDRATHRISHGYYVTPGTRSPYDYGMLYTEARLGSLIAIGKGDVPDGQWFEMVRVFPADCGGQTSMPVGTKVTRLHNHEVLAGTYQWQGLRFVPSWGGSMFEALMPTLVLDERRYAPQSLGANDRIHAVVQRRYAIEELGYPVWGISPSTVPQSGKYAEYGVRVLGARGYGAGAVTPHASALTLPFTPEAAIANLRTLAQRFAIYGEYGFYDAVEPHTGQVAYAYLALDQSMLFIALANALNDHRMQERFAADPIVQRVLPLLGDESFFD